jgi:hypothetical protein
MTGVSVGSNLTISGGGNFFIEGLYVGNTLVITGAGVYALQGVRASQLSFTPGESSLTKVTMQAIEVDTTFVFNFTVAINSYARLNGLKIGGTATWTIASNTVATPHIFFSANDIQQVGPLVNATFATATANGALKTFKAKFSNYTIINTDPAWGGAVAAETTVLYLTNNILCTQYDFNNCRFENVNDQSVFITQASQIHQSGANFYNCTIASPGTGVAVNGAVGDFINGSVISGGGTAFEFNASSGLSGYPRIHGTYVRAATGFSILGAGAAHTDASISHCTVVGTTGVSSALTGMTLRSSSWIVTTLISGGGTGSNSTGVAGASSFNNQN